MKQDMRALVLLNSLSSGYREGTEIVLPYLEHFGIPYVMVDLASSPLPQPAADHALIVVAHRHLDPAGLRLGPTGRRMLLAALWSGTGLVSFDPDLPSSAELGIPAPARRNVEVDRIELSPHAQWITARHEPGQIIPLVGSMHVPQLPAEKDEILLKAGEAPLVAARSFGQGRLVRWATLNWYPTDVLGPMAGLDDVFWRSLVWAARKPFAMRGLPPLVSMRVDDVAGRGGLFGQSPLYWVHESNKSGFKPWLGLFIYNLTEPAVVELGDLLDRGKATAFPHAFGRPPRDGASDYHYYPKALPLRASTYDEFIYFDHSRGRPWSDLEAARGLRAVDEWYADHEPLPKSPYALGHWYEMGGNVMAHIQDRWCADLIGKGIDLNRPLTDDVPWIKTGPFRRYGPAGTCFFDPARRGTRPIYYADFVNLAGRQFFNCITEIRDVAGYEWKPDNDVPGTVDRGARTLRRALDSMALAVLFTHETDFINLIRPEAWAAEISQVAARVAEYDPIYVTLDEGVRYVRATRTSRLGQCSFDPTSGEARVVVQGRSDMTTHFHLFAESGGEVRSQLVELPAFAGQTSVTCRAPQAA